MSEETTNKPETGHTATVQPASTGQTIVVERGEEPAATHEAEGLLAGKFKTPADLEKAYVELQSKLGAPREAEATPEATPEAEAAATAEAGDNGDNPYGEGLAPLFDAAGLNPADVAAQFQEHGKLTDEMYTALAEKANIPRAMVEAYERGQSQAAEQTASITQEQIADIKSVAGGDEGYTKMTAWMSANMSAEEITAFDADATSGDHAKAKAAVTAAHARYIADVGTEGELMSGSEVKTGGFANEAEYREAMKDPRYKTSEAYRNEVLSKLQASPNVFILR